MNMTRDFEDPHYKFARYFITHVAYKHKLKSTFEYGLSLYANRDFNILDVYKCIFGRMHNELYAELSDQHSNQFQFTNIEDFDKYFRSDEIMKRVYTTDSFITYLTYLTFVTVKLQTEDDLDCLETAVNLIGDTLDAYVKNGSFRKAGGWTELFRVVRNSLSYPN